MSKHMPPGQPYDGHHQRPDPRSSEPHDQPCGLCLGLYSDDLVAKITAADLMGKPITAEAFKAWLADVEPAGPAEQ